MATDPPITTEELTEALRGVLNLLAWQTRLIQDLLQKIGPVPPSSSIRRTKTSRKRPGKPRKRGDARN